MASHDVGQGSQFCSVTHPAGGVSRGVDHQQFGAGRDGGFQSLKIESKPVLSLRRNDHWLCPGEPCHFGVTQPKRPGDQHLIARVKHHLEQVEDGLLAPVGDQHVGGLGGNLVVAAQFFSNRFPQFGITGGWSVAGDAVLKRFDRCLDNEIGRVEVGFTGRHAADVSAFLLQSFGSGRNGQGERRLEGDGPMRQQGRAGHRRGTPPSGAQEDTILPDLVSQTTLFAPGSGPIIPLRNG